MHEDAVAAWESGCERSVEPAMQLHFCHSTIDLVTKNLSLLATKPFLFGIKALRAGQMAGKIHNGAEIECTFCGKYWAPVMEKLVGLTEFDAFAESCGKAGVVCDLLLVNRVKFLSEAGRYLEAYNASCLWLRLIPDARSRPTFGMSVSGLLLGFRAWKRAEKEIQSALEARGVIMDLDGRGGEILELLYFIRKIRVAKDSSLYDSVSTFRIFAMCSKTGDAEKEEIQVCSGCNFE